MKILLSLILFCAPAFACQKTDNHEVKSYELSEYKRDANYFGVYESPTSLTRGKRFYIFPNKSFAIVGFCDICMGEELLAKGTFEYTKSKIVLTFDTPYEGNKTTTYYLRVGSKYYADHSEDKDFLMLEEPELKGFSYEESIHKVLHNIQPYPDWQTKSQQFKEQNVLPKYSQ